MLSTLLRTINDQIKQTLLKYDLSARDIRETINVEDPSMSLLKLLSWMTRKKLHKLIILIDDFDHPMNMALTHNCSADDQLPKLNNMKYFLSRLKNLSNGYLDSYKLFFTIVSRRLCKI